MLRRSVSVSRYYEGTNCLHLQGLLRGVIMTPCMQGGKPHDHAGHAKGAGMR
jgi:hypothetical protein